jgi:hypothetical protein
MMERAHVRFALTVPLALLFAAASGAASAAPPVRIGTITIRALDVYADDEAGHGRVYRVANALHPETRDSVIRKFLLFRECDEYRPDRIAESERNLRALHFLKSASVTASEPHDGVVDVTVTTQDQGFRQSDRLYHDGFIASEFAQKHAQIVAAYGRSLGSSDGVANRLTAGVRFTDDSFDALSSHPEEVVPGPRRFRYAYVRFEHAGNDFLKLNFVNKDIRYEDFNLGAQVSVEAAVSPRAFGVDSTSSFLRMTASNGARIGERAFIVPSVAVESRFDGGPQNAIASACVTFVRRDSARFPQATVARVAINAGWRLDPETQFFADGLTGLRAYRVHGFAGTRSFVVNVERRLYLGREILQLISPGVVAFADAGNATNGGAGQLMRLYTDAGIGLRIGLPRTPKNLPRIDFGDAMKQDPRGRGGFMVSVSSGQAF